MSLLRRQQQKQQRTSASLRKGNPASNVPHSPILTRRFTDNLPRQLTSLTATVLEETTQMIDTAAVNVAADISKVALICQCSKNTKGMPRSRKRVICESLDNYCRWYLAR